MNTEIKRGTIVRIALEGHEAFGIVGDRRGTGSALEYAQIRVIYPGGGIDRPIELHIAELNVVAQSDDRGHNWDVESYLPEILLAQDKRIAALEAQCTWLAENKVTRGGM